MNGFFLNTLYTLMTLLLNRKRLHPRSCTSTRMITFLNYYNLAFLHPWERLARSRVYFAVTAKDHYELLSEVAMLFRQITEKILLRIDARGSSDSRGRFKRGPVTAKFNICGRAARLCIRGAKEFAVAAIVGTISAIFRDHVLLKLSVIKGQRQFPQVNSSRSFIRHVKCYELCQMSILIVRNFLNFYNQILFLDCKIFNSFHI